MVYVIIRTRPKQIMHRIIVLVAILCFNRCWKNIRSVAPTKMYLHICDISSVRKDKQIFFFIRFLRLIRLQFVTFLLNYFLFDVYGTTFEDNNFIKLFFCKFLWFNFVFSLIL